MSFARNPYAKYMKLLVGDSVRPYGSSARREDTTQAVTRLIREPLLLILPGRVAF